MTEKAPIDAVNVHQQASIEGKRIYGNKIQSIYLIGSLAHGGFSESTSDIDVAFILDQPEITETDWENFDAIDKKIKSNPGLRFGHKLSLFWSTSSILTNELTSGAFPVPRRDQGVFPPYDVLDLIQNGTLLQGEELRDTFRKPTIDDLCTAGVEFMLSYVNTERNNESITNEDAFDALSNHDKSKLILFPARLMYTLGTGKVGDNIEAAEKYLADTPTGPISDAINQAMEIRRSNSYDPVILSSSFPTLIDLYRQLITLHKDTMNKLNLTDYSDKLDAWLNELESRASRS